MTDIPEVVIPAFKLERGELAIAATAYLNLAILQYVRPDALEVLGNEPDTGSGAPWDMSGWGFPHELAWRPFDDADLNLRQAMTLIAAELGETVVGTFPDQTEIGRWAEDNGFDHGSTTEQVIGIAEEVGELAEAWNVLALMGAVGKLCRAANKRTQGIRGTYEEWTKEIEKELGDIFIKTTQVCDALGYDFATLARARWETVSKRKDKFGIRPDERVESSVDPSCDHVQRWRGCVACDNKWRRS